MGDVASAIGGNIERVRRIRKMTGKQLAGRLDELGLQMSVATISEVERAKRKVSVGELLVFAIALNASLIDLLTPLNGERLTVTDKLDPIPPDVLFYWLRGDQPWPGADREAFGAAATEPTRHMLKLFDSVHIKAVSALADNIRLTDQPELRRLIDPKLLASGLRESLDNVNKAVGDLLSNLDVTEGGSHGG